MELVPTHHASFQQRERKWTLHILAPLLSRIKLKLRGIRLVDIRSPLSPLTDLRLYVPIESLEMFKLLGIWSLWRFVLIMHTN